MKNDGGAAFPIPNATDMDGYVYAPETRGMSLRDYMAGQALALIKWQLDEGFKNEQRPEYCKELASVS